jgi:hypothetical protein
VTRRRPRSLLVGLAALLLAGCESAEPRPEEPPPATQPSPTNLQSHEDTPEPTSPPYSSPRPKVGPGSVMLEEDNPREGVR